MRHDVPEGPAKQAWFARPAPKAPKDAHRVSLAEQCLDRLPLAVTCYIERPLFDFVREFGRDAQRVENARVQVFNNHAVFDRLARALIGGQTVEMAAFDSSAKQQHAARVG